MHSILDDGPRLPINNLLCTQADEILVMNPLAESTLKRIAKNHASKIKFIHHPCYNVPFAKLPVQKNY
jgi:hypothetical protein